MSDEAGDVSQEHQKQSEGADALLSLNRPKDSAFAGLEAAADEGDPAAFAASLALVDSHTLAAEDFVRIMRLALKAGAYLDAREVSVLALQHHPDDDEVKKFARVLAPPRILSSTGRPDPGIRANRDWLKAHSSEYAGQWVALRAGELLGAAGSVKELVALVGDTKGVLLTIAC